MSEHECYRRIVLNKDSRCLAYEDLVRLVLADSILDEVRRAAAFSLPLGDSRFHAQIEKVVSHNLHGTTGAGL